MLHLKEHMNLIFSKIPCRYDRNENHIQNKQIKEINTVIRNICYSCCNIHLLDLYMLEWWYHTRHGLHINRQGRNKYPNRLVNWLLNNVELSFMKVSFNLANNRHHLLHWARPVHLKFNSWSNTCITIRHLLSWPIRKPKDAETWPSRI